MVDFKKDQSILILGVSGSGKTEAQKVVLKYFHHGVGVSSLRKDNQKFFDTLSASLKVLETFGNASTLFNYNSSRFGQKTKLFFDSNGLIIGSKIGTYLFEKNRTIGDFGPGERNFKIFYQLVCGANKEQKKRLGLTNFSNYAYLRSKDITVDDMEETSEFKRTNMFLEEAKFTKLEIANIFLTLAVILHIGNLVFESKNGATSILNRHTLTLVASLLQCKDEYIEEMLCTPTLVSSGISRSVKLSKEKAKISADYVAKLLYYQIFEYIRLKINTNIAPQGNISRTISVLEMKGFENNTKNKRNGLEQFCTNYTEEVFQSIFYSHLFNAKLTKEKFVPGTSSICKREMGFVLQNFDKIFKGNNVTMGETKNMKPFMNTLTISHTYGNAVYSCDRFPEKNKEIIFSHIINSIASVKYTFIKNLFSSEKLKKNYQKNIFSARVLEKTQKLTEKIALTQTNFICCLSTIEHVSDGYLDNKFLLSQIKNNGLIEQARLKSYAYSVIYPFEQFVMRYRALLPKQTKIEKTQEFTLKVLKALFFNFEEMSALFVDNECIYLKEIALNHLESKLSAQKKKSAAILLKYILRAKFRNRVIEIGRAALNRKNEIEISKSKSDYIFKGYDVNQVKAFFANLAVNIVQESIKIYKYLKSEVIQRQSILQSVTLTLSFLKQFSKEATLASPNLTYIKSVQEVKKSMVNFCEKIKDVLRASKQDLPDKIREINILHNQVSNSIKQWKILFGNFFILFDLHLFDFI